MTALHARLPTNRGEPVLFDISRNTKLGPLLRADPETLLDRLIPPGPRTFKTRVITTASPDSAAVIERSTEADDTRVRERDLGLTYPRDVLSLSQVALPFPIDDSLYGALPDPRESFGANPGALAVRGERGVPVMSLAALVRLSWNPFFPYVLELFPYVLERIEEGIETPAP